MKLSLLPRVVLALTAAGVIPLAFAVVQLVNINRGGMTTQVLRTHSVAARATAERCAAILSALRTPAAALADNPALVNGHDEGVMQSLLVGFLQARPDVLGAVVLNGDGAEVVRVQRREAADAVVASISRLPSTEPLVIDDPHGLRLALSVPLAETANVLCVIADAAELVRLLQPEELGEQAQLVIMNREGRMVLALDAADRRGFTPEIVAAATSGKVTGSGRFKGIDGDFLGAFSAVAGSDWVILSRQPAAVAEEAARRMLRRASLAVGVGVVLIAAIAFGAYRSLVLPLREVAEAQRRLAGATRAPKKGAEIEILRESYASLERLIMDRHEMDQIFLGRYQVVELLGEGAMGSVFRGWDPKLQRHVALKTIRMGPSGLAFGKEGLAANLLREAVLIARFSHPNIVGVFDLEDTPEAAFVAMEYVEGLSLEDYRLDHPTMQPCHAAVLGAAVAHALAAAHDQDMVHHDIKPGNILLGYDGAIKVSDFGIATTMSAAIEGEDRVVGTPGYLPPEALTGEGFDARGDLFALGVVLYECLAGNRPYQATSYSATIRNTIKGIMRPLSEVSPQTPQPLAQLVGELLAHDPELRPASAEEVAGRLDEFIAENQCSWRAPSREQERRVADESDHESLRVLPTTRMPVRRAGG